MKNKENTSEKSQEELLKQLRESQGQGDALIEISRNSMRTTFGKPSKDMTQVIDEMYKMAKTQEKWMEEYSLTDLMYAEDQVMKKLQQDGGQ